MKKIDTLFLSGGGINSIAYLGVFKYLFEKNIIEKDLKNIKNIVCVSGSALIVFPILLGYPLNVLIDISLKFNTENLIDYNNFDINQLLTNFGIYENDFFENLYKLLLKRKKLPLDITMKQLYDHSNVNFIIKTANITKYKIEYINHINFPDLPVMKALRMTSCIPFIFKPIIYKGDYYVDGGLCGNYPIEYNKKIKSKNYLGVQIKSIDENKKIDNILNYMLKLTMAPISPYDDINVKKKNHIILKYNTSGLDMNINKETVIKEIAKSYKNTEDYFKNH